MAVFDQEHKDKVGKALTFRIADALENNELTDETLAQVAKDVLDGLNSVANHDALIVFLETLVQKWPFFATILAMEKGEVLEEQVGEKTKQIAQHIRNGNIDEALRVAKSA